MTQLHCLRLFSSHRHVSSSNPSRLRTEMDSNRVQLPQDILDDIIDFLYDSPSDLKSCSLTSRACVYRAQAHVFSYIVFRKFNLPHNERLWSRLQQIFHNSPHLIRHVRGLDLRLFRTSPDTFAAICTFPFTHLRIVRVSSSAMSLQSALALQQLLSLPTLREVEVKCSFADPADFLQIWDRCSPHVKRLDFRCLQTTTKAFPSIPQRDSPPIRLETLHLDAGAETQDWLNHPMCPFDCSGLKALSIRGLTDMMTACTHTLRFLDISVRIPFLSPRPSLIRLLEDPINNRPIFIPETRTLANVFAPEHVAEYACYNLVHLSLQLHSQNYTPHIFRRFLWSTRL
jgi:hypothetical protein